VHFLTVYAVALLAAVLISGLAERSILSTAVLFLLVGLGSGALGILQFEGTEPFVENLMMLTLFSILYTDGMRVGLSDLRDAWYLPGRALICGMPLTLLFTAISAHWIVGLSWVESFLIGAILSPTDPVFVAALLGRKEVPESLKRLLNVESGVNDGLALPVVIYLIAVARHGEFSPLLISGEVLAGIALGLAIPWIAIRLEQSRFFSASVAYRPLNAFAIGLLVLGICYSLDANEYLAAFVAGIAVASLDPTLKESFHRFGEMVSELLKLAALLVFGSLIPIGIWGASSGADYLFVATALFVVRPLAMSIALLGSSMPWRERATAAWFGPKGFASVAYGILVVKSQLLNVDHLLRLIALVISGSIILHSSTDALISNWYAGRVAKARGSNEYV